MSGHEHLGFSNSPEPSKSPSISRRIIAGFIAGLEFVGEYLAESDPNPHIGRLRGSIMPTKYGQDTDHPPIPDDTKK